MTGSTGIIATIAGTGATGYSGDGGAATSATVQKPYGINLDSSGNIYYGGDESSYHVIRKITVSTGIITTVAGTASATSGGFSGDGGPATSALLNSPSDVVLDSSDNLYIADYKNNCIRKVTVATGIITTFAGTRKRESNGDGSEATSAGILGPKFSRFDSSSSNYYISESDSNKVRIITNNSPTSTPTTISTAIPTATPTLAPTNTPSYIPSNEISARPTSEPTSSPTSRPTTEPTSEPSSEPTSSPTSRPTAQPTSKPTSEPSSRQTSRPTSMPTLIPR